MKSGNRDNLFPRPGVRGDDSQFKIPTGFSEVKFKLVSRFRGGVEPISRPNLDALDRCPLRIDRHRCCSIFELDDAL